MAKIQDGNGTVASCLLDYIHAAGLKHGQRLPSIRQLSAELALSPTLVREAMLQIQTMGIVKIHPRAGVFVQALDVSPLANVLANSLQAAIPQMDAGPFDLIDARRLIEIENAGRAAASHRAENLLMLERALAAIPRTAKDHAAYFDADVGFHLAIADMAGNIVLNTVLRSIFTLLRPIRLSHRLYPADVAVSKRGHEEMFRLIVKEDVEGARAEMQKHLEFSRQSLLERIHSTPYGNKRQTRTE